MKWPRYYLFTVILIWLALSPPDISAHHANLAGGQRDFLHSHLPHNSTIVNFNDYTLFLTVIDRAPGTIDILLYLEDTLKRPVFGKRAVVIENNEGKQVFNGILEPDKTGIFHLRYAYDKPLAARLKVAYAEPQRSPDYFGAESQGSPDNFGEQWITADIQLGSPAPNIFILALLGAVLLAAIVVVGYKVSVLHK